MTYAEYIEPWIGVSEKDWNFIQNLVGDITEDDVTNLSPESNAEDLLKEVILNRIDPHNEYIESISINGNAIEIYEYEEVENLEKYRVATGEFLEHIGRYPIFYEYQEN